MDNNEDMKHGGEGVDMQLLEAELAKEVQEGSRLPPTTPVLQREESDTASAHAVSIAEF